MNHSRQEVISLFKDEEMDEWDEDEEEWDDDIWEDDDDDW